MSISISGSNSISGLSGNDTDFDKVLTQLKQIESTQLNRLEAWKADWQMRYDAFGEIIDQVRAASSMLSQLADKNNFVTKQVASSNENIITAVANAAAQDVQHSIKVSQVASNAIWANTGHVFKSKTDIINTSGEKQAFRFNYAGKDYSIDVPANTNLESFASMVNNSTENPGIKISLIQTGQGYVFQVAGKDTGASNNLIIYNTNLVGMNATGTQSTWQTNNVMDISQTLTNPTDYVFDLVLQGGAKKSVTISGTASMEQIRDQLNNAAGGINARIDEESGDLLMDVQSFSVRTSDDAAYTPASLNVNVGGKIDVNGKDTNYLIGADSEDKLTFTVTLDSFDKDGNPNTREFTIDGKATYKDLLTQLAQATQGGSSGEISLNGSKGWSINLSGVKGITAKHNGEDFDFAAAGITFTEKAASGVRDDRSSATSFTSTLTFDKDKLDTKLSDADPPTTLHYTIVKADGSADYVEISSDKTFQALADKLVEKGAILSSETDKDGNTVLTMDGVKSVTLTTGSTKEAGFSASLEATTTVLKTNLLKGGDLLESPPDLVYTVTTNDGLTGTLTLPSGSRMRAVLAAMEDPSSAVWAWKDASGNEATAPTNLGAVFTDPDGNEVNINTVDLSTPVLMTLKNVQSMSGPAMAGQVATSDNWSIQRSANARYQVDNWPIEMESESNSVGDVIEGVVFSIQEVGDARISVSTDITSVEQSIQNFLDAVNSILLTVNNLTAFDESKSVTSNDPDDIGKDNYSASGLTNQKGSLLTGNYGVPLFKSRLSSVITSSPPGFKNRQSADDVLSGDLLASLANLGIKTDTDQNSDTYGLLVLAPASGIGQLQSMDKENYNKLITNNLEAVVDFFCATGTGSSSSTDFRYGSHVEGITKAGNYEVRYSVNDDGSIGDVFVGGVKAVRDESMPGNYYSVASGDARGLAILIDDLTPGEHPPAGAEPMQVRIKQGLVQTVNSFLKDELVFNDVSIHENSTPSQIADALALKSKNGALMSLQDNYKNVMEGIDAKIEREQRRISTWEARQKAIFANLETLLKQYSEQQTSLEAQLTQLSGNSK